MSGSPGAGEEVNGAILGHSYAGQIEVPSEYEAPIFNQRDACLATARSERLKAATGALMALGLEVAAGFGIYLVWHLRHIAR